MHVQHTQLPGRWPDFCLGRALPAQKGAPSYDHGCGLLPRLSRSWVSLGSFLDSDLQISAGVAERGFYVCPGEHRFAWPPQRLWLQSPRLSLPVLAPILGTGDGAICAQPAADFGDPVSKHRLWFPAADGPAPPCSAPSCQRVFLTGGCAHMWHPASASLAEWVLAPQGAVGLPSAPLAMSPARSLRVRRTTHCTGEPNRHCWVGSEGQVDESSLR